MGKPTPHPNSKEGTGMKLYGAIDSHSTRQRDSGDQRARSSGVSEALAQRSFVDGAATLELS